MYKSAGANVESWIRTMVSRFPYQLSSIHNNFRFQTIWVYFLSHSNKIVFLCFLFLVQKILQRYCVTNLTTRNLARCTTGKNHYSHILWAPVGWTSCGSDWSFHNLDGEVRFHLIRSHGQEANSRQKSYLTAKWLFAMSTSLGDGKKLFSPLKTPS
jgi:hypothetical protein